MVYLLPFSRVILATCRPIEDMIMRLEDNINTGSVSCVSALARLGSDQPLEAQRKRNLGVCQCFGKTSCLRANMGV